MIIVNSDDTFNHVKHLYEKILLKLIKISLYIRYEGANIDLINKLPN